MVTSAEDNSIKVGFASLYPPMILTLLRCGSSTPLMGIQDCSEVARVTKEPLIAFASTELSPPLL
jgi:hypothetical protein